MQNGPIARLKSQAARKYGLIVSPYFKTGWELTSNTFKSPNPERQDVLWTFAPGVNITHRGDYGEVGLNYEAQFRYFTRHGKQNEQDNGFSVYGDFYPVERLNVKVSESLQQQGSTAGARGVEPLDSFDNTVTASVIYEVTDQVDNELGYRNFMREYDGKNFDTFSYMENEYFDEVFYQLNENHRLYTGYHLGLVDYDKTNSRNAYYHVFPVGSQGNLPYGIEYKAEMAAYVRNQQADDRNDFFMLIGSVDLKKQLTERTAIGAGFLRRPVESTFAGTEVFDEKTFYGNLTHRLSQKVRARMDISTSGRDFDSRATVGAVTVKRKDQVFSFGLGMDYAVRRWLVVNADYRVERRNSNLSPFDYTDNRFVLGATVPI